jgi:hypothetical protein
MTTSAQGQPLPDAVCPCGHTAEQHDFLASRYCRATITSALDRGCMCVTASVLLPR